MANYANLPSTNARRRPEPLTCRNPVASPCLEGRAGIHARQGPGRKRDTAGCAPDASRRTCAWRQNRHGYGLRVAAGRVIFRGNVGLNACGQSFDHGKRLSPCDLRDVVDSAPVQDILRLWSSLSSATHQRAENSCFTCGRSQNKIGALEEKAICAPARRPNANDLSVDRERGHSHEPPPCPAADASRKRDDRLGRRRGLRMQGLA